MGNCIVTVCKNKESADVNLGAQIKPPNQHMVEHQETSFRDSSKTEENFFDSNPWLESDCEDFFSVNGDSTLSCGNSPKNQKNSKENSMAVTKKQLFELFRERSDDDDDDA